MTDAGKTPSPTFNIGGFDAFARRLAASLSLNPPLI